MIPSQQTYNNKLLRLLLYMLVYFFIIAARLFYLQVIKYQYFAQSGKKNFLRCKIVPAQRGNIVDFNGKPLATNQPVTELLWAGTGNVRLSVEQENAIEKINEILGYESTPKYKIKRAEKFKTEIVIASSITNDQLCLIAEQCSDALNLTFKTKFERFYPYDRLASHVLGYLGDMHYAAEGKMGLEKICEETLRGDPGILQQSVNSFGSLLESTEIKQGTAGGDIVTSLDLTLQTIIEECMADQEAGSCIILEPNTGLIKALVSKPNFQPTIFSTKLSPEVWQEMQKKKMFLNRAFNASYPPASIFKLVTIAAALEEKLISTESHYTCCGHIEFKDRTYYCNKHSGHGLVSVEECIAKSCNIPFYEIAKRIHIDTLASYAKEFGLGSKTNVPFSEQYGLVPTNEWKKKHKGERWWTGETLSAAIGQSFLLVTPIQVACMIGSIFHGYLVRPRILVDTQIEKIPIDISAHTRHFLQGCMGLATTAGTCVRVNKIGTLTIFAKTGTAQTTTRQSWMHPKDVKESAENMPHAWFISYFYTDSNPQPLVMVMLLEHVGKSAVATAVARRFLVQYAKLSNLRV